MSNSLNKNPSLDDSVWSLYWSQDRLHSCVASIRESDQNVINSLWSALALDLPLGAQVLDLATGNGAVPAAMLAQSPGLSIDAVDRADIDPQFFLPKLESHKMVRFHGNIDIVDMPFEANSFDAVSSQYGIEYAGLLNATKKVMPLIRMNGVFALFLHHTDSALIASAEQKIVEMEALLIPSGLIETLTQVLKSDAEFAQLELVGQQYLEGSTPKTKSISGQVFNGIEQVARAMSTNMSDAIQLGATLRLRLESEFERLRQMQASAQSEESLNKFCVLLESNGFSLEENHAVNATPEDQDYLLGQFIRARKIN